MTKATFLRALCSALVLAMAVSCGTARRGEPFKGPMSYTNSDVAQGHIVFEEYCSRCHPGGEAGLGPSLNDKPLPGFMIKMQVRNGLGVMPAFKEEHLSDEQLRHLVKYMKALRKHG